MPTATASPIFGRMIMWTLAATAGGALLIDRAALMTLRPPRRAAERVAADMGHPVTPVELTVDGLAIRGSLIEPQSVRPDSPIAVLIHGWTGDSGTMLNLAKPLLAAGLPVLVFDVRSHGRSDRASAVTVRHFRDDLLAMLDSLREIRPGRRIVVIGHSLGGAAAILAKFKGAPIDALALVAVPANLFEVSAGFFSDRGLPGGLMVKLFQPSWRLRAGEPFRHLDPEARARDLAGSVPITIIQGDLDTRVRPAAAARLAEATGAEVVTIEGAAHRDVLTNQATHTELLRFIASLED